MSAIAIGGALLSLDTAGLAAQVSQAQPAMETGMIIGGFVLVLTQVAIVAVAIVWYRKTTRDRETQSSR